MVICIFVSIEEIGSNLYSLLGCDNDNDGLRSKVVQNGGLCDIKLYN